MNRTTTLQELLYLASQRLLCLALVAEVDDTGSKSGAVSVFVFEASSCPDVAAIKPQMGL